MRMDKAKLVTKAAVNLDRANCVRTDPAVRKAAVQASADLGAAARSTGALAQEVTASWRRHGE